MSASAAAGALASPVLLTAPDRLSPPARNAIAAWEPDRILVVGGNDALGDAVVDGAMGLTDDVQRLGGRTRIGTSAVVAGYLADN